MTTEQLYNEFLIKLQSIYDEREADNINDWIFEKVTSLKKMNRRINKDVEVKSDYASQLDKYLKELLLHKPVQYVLNEAWFYKMKFFVNEHVLIPRPETEELVSWIIDDMRSTMFVRKTPFSDGRFDDFKLLDIGTGSGCISISLKKNLNNIKVNAIDVSTEALVVAKGNAVRLDTEIDFLQTDFLDEKFWAMHDPYDLIVSNPPYIPENEIEKLSKTVTAFEPPMALFVQSNNPFIFYKKIAKFAQTHLSSKGKIYVEIHEDYYREVEQIFLKHNFKTEIKKDIYGKERMMKAIK
jgi:release factor glutamine methyltransferase